MALKELQVQSAKPREKAYKLSDGEGLVLLITPAGGRLWRFRYRFQGKEQMISLGAYPAVTLKDARESRDTVRKQLAKGINPTTVRQETRSGGQATFGAIAEEWLGRQTFTAKTREKAEWMLNELAGTFIKDRPIKELTAPEILGVLRRIEARGRLETCHRTKWRIGQVIRYAIATGRADRDPTADLKGALATPKVVNRRAITAPKRFGELLLALDGYSGQLSTAMALKLAPLVFVRPGELRAARWDEFSLEGDQPVWRIPATRMKMKEEHIVPLSRQAVQLLKDLQPYARRSAYLFPSVRSVDRPISDNTINAALRRLGYDQLEMTAHGFRASASTMLNELGVAPDVIELQLAHAERNKVRAAYNRAQRLAERRDMMQKWADYLDGLRAAATKATVVSDLQQAA
jgi:integrase